MSWSTTPTKDAVVGPPSSLFHQLLARVPRNAFASLLREHGGEIHAKGFTCWAQSGVWAGPHRADVAYCVMKPW